MYGNLIKRLRDILNGKTMNRELWVETITEAIQIIAEMVEKNNKLADDFTNQCPTCRGKGKLEFKDAIGWRYDRCQDCHGTGGGEEMRKPDFEKSSSDGERRMTDYIKGPDGIAYYSHRRKGVAYVRPYIPGEDLVGISVSKEDIPKHGDKIAINPDNIEDRWLIEAGYFEKNFEVPNDHTTGTA